MTKIGKQLNFMSGSDCTCDEFMKKIYASMLKLYMEEYEALFANTDAPEYEQRLANLNRSIDMCKKMLEKKHEH